MAMAGVLDRAKKTMVSICAVMVSQLVLCVYCNVQSVLYTLYCTLCTVHSVSAGQKGMSEVCEPWQEKWNSTVQVSCSEGIVSWLTGCPSFSFYLLFLTCHIETHSFIHQINIIPKKTEKWNWDIILKLKLTGYCTPFLNNTHHIHGVGVPALEKLYFKSYKLNVDLGKS